MKAFVILLSTSFFATSLALAGPAGKGCGHSNCACTQQVHCGCMSEKGCNCTSPDCQCCESCKAGKECQCEILPKGQ